MPEAPRMEGGTACSLREPHPPFDPHSAAGQSPSTSSLLVPYGAASAPGQVVRTSALPFEATLARLREAIAAEDLWIIHEIDPQALLERGGFCIRPARQVLFFHPRYMARLLAGDPGAVVEAPLKLVVMQEPGGAVRVRHPDVAAGFARYPGLEALGGELAELCGRLLETVS